MAGKCSPDDRSEFRHTKRHFKYCRLSISQRVGTAAGPTKEKFRPKYFIQNRIYMLLEDVCCVHLRSKPNVTIHKNGLDAHRQLNQSLCFALWRVHFEKWKDVFTQFSPIVGKGKITSSIIACPPFCDAIRSSLIGNKFSTFFLGFPDDAVIVDAGGTCFHRVNICLDTQLNK